MIYEYRVYEAVPGKMAALHARFANHTTRIFERHGIKNIGYWMEEVGTSGVLHYIVAFEDMAQRERAWQAFRNDPEWQKARVESEKDGTLVARVTNRIWVPTPYSPLK